jgi:ferredoxin
VNIPSEAELLTSMAEVTADCVKCGKCLAGCPAYRVTAHESGGMRGRLALVQAAVRGFPLEPDLATKVLQRCTLCASCARECPNEVATQRAVVLGRLLFKRRKQAAILAKSPFRPVIRGQRAPSDSCRSGSDGETCSTAGRPLLAWYCSGNVTTAGFPWADHLQGGFPAPVSVPPGLASTNSRPSSDDSCASGAEAMKSEAQDQSHESLAALLRRCKHQVDLLSGFPCLMSIWAAGDLDEFLELLAALVARIGNHSAGDRGEKLCFCPDCQWVLDQVVPELDMTEGERTALSRWRPPWEWLTVRLPRPRKRRAGRFALIGSGPGQLPASEWEALISLVQACLKEPPVVVPAVKAVWGAENSLPAVWPDLAGALALAALDDLARKGLNQAIVIGRATHELLKEPASRRGIALIPLFEFLGS